jgi:hypothetical protein
VIYRPAHSVALSRMAINARHFSSRRGQPPCFVQMLFRPFAG